MATVRDIFPTGTVQKLIFVPVFQAIQDGTEHMSANFFDTRDKAVAWGEYYEKEYTYSKFLRVEERNYFYST